MRSKERGRNYVKGKGKGGKRERKARENKDRDRQEARRGDKCTKVKERERWRGGDSVVERI